MIFSSFLSAQTSSQKKPFTFRYGVFFLSGLLFLSLSACSTEHEVNLQDEIEAEHGHDEPELPDSGLLDRPAPQGFLRYEDANLRVRVDYPELWRQSSDLFGTEAEPEWQLSLKTYEWTGSYCPVDYASIQIVGPRFKPEELSFDAFVHSPEHYLETPREDERDSGKWWGTLERVKFGGKTAYRVESLGWERLCNSPDYLVELAPDVYAEVEVSAGTGAAVQAKLQTLLDSLVFQ